MADIVDLLGVLKENIPQALRVCMPAKIETYDFKTQKASVKIDMLELFNDGTTEDYPIVSGVPVVFMASGGASINLPVLKGDCCFIIFFDRDMSNWLLGGTGQKPNSTRMHNMSDAVAIMGLSPFTNTSKAENNTDVLINYSGSKIIIKPDGILTIETTKDININSAEVVNMNSKNINITATENIKVNCVNAEVTATEDINITCNNSNITVNENATITSKNITVNNSENITITNGELITVNSKNITIENSENITVNSKDLIITAIENVNVNSKTANLTTTENVNINCVDAVIVASNEIQTTSVKFVQTGDMSISGKLEVGDGITNKGDINNDGDINNFGNIVNNGGQIRSGVVVLDTHTHGYEAPVVGSEPTAAIPAFTSAPV